MKSRLPLSPVDHVFYGKDAYSVEFLLSFEYRLDRERLRRALETTVAKFWPVGARLELGPNREVLLVASSNPVDLVEVPGSSAAPDLTDPKALADFSRPVQSIQGEPLARFQLSHCGKGSLFVASISHAVVDGYSYFFFLSTLAAVYRASFFSREFWKVKLLRPDHDRSKLSADIGKGEPLSGAPDPQAIFLHTGLAFSERRKLPSLSQSRWEFVRFSDEEISRQLAATTGDSSLRLSKNDIITALLWKKIAGEWSVPGDTLDQSNAFDYRRVYKRLSPLYFGNAVRAASLRLPREEVLKSSLGVLASRIRKTVGSIQQEAAIDSLRYLSALRLGHGPEVFSHIHVSHPQQGFLVTNLSRVPLQSMDFGRGAPSELVPLTAAPRGAILTAASGSKDVIARLGLPA